MNLRSSRRIALGLLIPLLGACAGSGADEADSDFDSTVLQAEVPAELQTGAALFATNCSACHGERGLGSDRGPPLVHIIYEPSHHSDLAFLVAVDRGVRAHHWQFGDMPPVVGLEQAEVAEIVAYIRFLQRQVGIAWRPPAPVELLASVD